MRKVVVHMQSTLNNRIANAEGVFWEPFPWGEEEQGYINQAFRLADTWALSRVMYEGIIPWWDMVAAGQAPDDAPPMTPAFTDFAQIQSTMKKVVFSRAMASAAGRRVVSGDLVAALTELKDQDGGDILLSAGPATLGPLISEPGLVDEYLIVLHPAVITAGPAMFEHLTRDLALTPVEVKTFDGGAIVMRHRVLPANG